VGKHDGEDEVVDAQSKEISLQSRRFERCKEGNAESPAIFMEKDPKDTRRSGIHPLGLLEALNSAVLPFLFISMFSTG
jgi:hypothetical protein